MSWSDAIGRSGQEATVDVWAVPRASRTEVVGIHDGALRIKVRSPPVEGRANEELAELLREVFGVAPVLVSGTTHRRKRFKLPACSPEEAVRRLESHGAK